jgi:hypothetical protein
LQDVKDIALIVIGKPVEGERILANNHARRDRRLLSDVQTRQSGRRAKKFKADPTHINNDR